MVNSEPCIVCGAVESHTPWCTVPVVVDDKGAYAVFSLTSAKKHGQALLDHIRPYIKRSMFVGSIGREESMVGDIDILVEPKNAEAIKRIKASLMNFGSWNRGADRMMVVDNLYGSGIKLDLFLCHAPAQWGVLVGVRLNPKDLVIWAKAKLDGLGYQREGGTVKDRHGVEVHIPDERDWFHLLEIEWTPANRRYELCKTLGIEISKQ